MPVIMSPRVPVPNYPATETASLASVVEEALAPGLLVVNDREEILSCSPAAGRLLCLPADQTSGCMLSALPEALQKMARTALAQGLPIPPHAVAGRAGPASPRFRIGASPFRTAEGAVHVVLTVQDDALIQRLEQSLHRLDRLAGMGTLSAGLAHEIKNAFVAVRTFVDLLLEKQPEAELGDVVARELRRIDAILGQMLRFRTHAKLTRTTISVHEVLDHSLRLLKHQLENKQITLERDLTAAHHTILGDDYQLEQAFVNLLFNALDAMGPNGTLTVRTEMVADPSSQEAARQIRVTIADNGMGIPPENLAHLFEPFFTTKPNGTGLGLAITRRLLREHGGDISAESRVNQGTTFHIVLPLV